MELEFWYLAMKEIMNAFLAREYKIAVERIREFLALFSLKWCEENVLNQEQFNDLLDTALLLRGLGQYGVIECNGYYLNTVHRLEQAVKTYTTPTAGQPQALYQALVSAKLLCDGIWVAASYLESKELRLDHSPILLSFELSEAGTIKLYGWTDEPAQDTAEYREEEAVVAELKADFERLFAQRKAAKADVLAEASILWQAGEPAAALKLLEQAIKKDSSIQQAAFLLQADIHEQMQQPSQLIDCLMKAMLLGTSKSLIRARVRRACAQILEQLNEETDITEWKRWKEFSEDF